ncbi:MAG: molybdopterin-dependent oxidoreductase [Verrucomicrobiales bacterium]|nr:molybdopterin-dependent oxidoreductase [Verrucomicrobiales bacterium]
MSEEKSDLIDVQINGEWHSFPKGTRMIEACREAGVEVPHYCYHPKLTSPGNCRMCLVEMGMPPRPRPGDDPPEPDEEGHLPISWIPRPAIACANTIAPNMGIRTESEMTEECRKGVMELLLANHPLDCPICDQAGECSLQEFSVEHGKGESRFREQKVKKPKNVEVGPRIRLDDERCIMCSRCIRFTDEIADDPVLGFTDRGSHTVLAVYPGRELANNYSLNTVDICPVGALTSNDFRFQMRVWFMKETKTIDTNCATGANITVFSREDKIYRITPRQNNDVNSDWMPDSHRLNFHWIESEARLTDPLVKKGGVHEQAGWQEAIATSADKLAGLEGSEIAIIASARMTNEELLMTNRLVKHLKAGHVDTVARNGEADGYLISADRNPNTNGVKLVLGLDNPGSQIEAIKKGIEQGRIKAVIALQENLVDDAGFSAELLAKLDFLFTTYPLANPTADAAHVVLPGAGWAEKSGTMINVTGRLQRLNKVIDGPGQTLEPWEIIRDLIQATGGGNGIYAVTDIFKQLTQEVSEFKDLTWGQIGDLGIPLIETGETIPLLEREKERVAKGLIVG